MSQHRISRVGVVGAGVMGTGIAAHLASAGIDVLLVDIVPRDAPAADGTAKTKAARNAICKSGLDKALALKPAAFQRTSDASRITLGNLQDDLAALGACDWIVEAVTERLDIKNAVFNAIEPFRKAHTIITSNTSGIPLATMAEGKSEGFKKNFLITHFFNPGAGPDAGVLQQHRRVHRPGDHREDARVLPR